MSVSGHHTLGEITSQAEAWADALTTFKMNRPALEQAWQALAPRRLLFIGCGSTYYLSLTAAALFQEWTGLPARACPASEVVLFPKMVLGDVAETLLVAVSRSGQTTETLRAVETFRQAGGRAAWAITCHADSALARGAQLALVARAAAEQSVVQTRSFSSMLVLAQASCAALGGHDLACLDELPDLVHSLLRQGQAVAEQLGSAPDWDRYFFLGSGPQYGLAQEAMLKLKEVSLSHCEAFHFMEFRHGPVSMVDERTLVFGLHSGAALGHEQRVMDSVARLGAGTLRLLPSPEPSSPRQVSLPVHLPAWALPAFYLPVLQLFAYYCAARKGLNPDSPRHLEAVVSLDDWLPQT